MAFLDETGLAELWALVKEEDAKAPKFVYGSYSGAGTYYKEFTFDFEPKLLIIMGDNSTPGHMILIRNATYGMGVGGYTYFQPLYVKNSNSTIDITWSGNKVSWYGKNTEYACDNAGVAYHYVAMG